MAIGIFDPMGFDLLISEIRKSIVERRSIILDLERELEYLKRRKTSLLEDNPFQHTEEIMDLLKNEKNIKTTIKNEKENIISLQDKYQILCAQKIDCEKSYQQKERELKFEKYLHIKNNISTFLYDCSEDFFSQGSGNDNKSDFIPTNEIKNTDDLRLLLSYIEKEYSDIAENASAKGKSYYIRINSFPLLHPLYLYTVFYLLIKADAKIYFDAENADSYDDISSIALTISKRYPKAHILEMGLNEALEDGIKIDHIIDMGDFCNLHCRTDNYNIDNVSLHFPGAVTILIDYSTEDIPPEDDKKLTVLGHNCYEGLVDYDAYRGKNNKAEECSFGFDYGDLFWGAEAVVNGFNSLKIKHDKAVIYAFTDKSNEELGLPEYTNKCCTLIRSENLDVNRPNYDFTQLFN